MSDQRLPWRFWLITLVALVVAASTFQLGRWQLSRAEQKLALAAEIVAQQQLPALDNLALTDAAAKERLQHRRVRLRGRWLTRGTVYLDNRQMGGTPGFFVLTPLKLEQSDLTIVVQRGWVQRSFVDRAALPILLTELDSVEIDGRIAPPPAKLYEFDAPQRGDIRQNLELPGFALEIGVPLAGFTVLQLGPPDDGLLRDWQPVNTGVEKHQGYAFQWFALSGLVALLYFWFQIVRRFILPR